MSDGDSSESITKEFVNTLHTIESVNSQAKIIVSSIIPRRNDKMLNDKIKESNKALQSMCADKGYYFLNNDSGFLSYNAPDRSMFRDNIHLNAKGGKVLGVNMRNALNSVLGIQQSLTNVESSHSNFHNGRYSGRGNQFFNNREMVFMPAPQYWQNNRNPWVVPGHAWN